MQIDGVNELRQAKGMPVYTMGTATLRGLRRSHSSPALTQALLPLS